MSQDSDDTRRSDDPAEPLREAAVLEQIRQALKGLRFGNVSIIVQDGMVVQIERTEKRRFDRSRRDKPLS